MNSPVKLRQASGLRALEAAQGGRIAVRKEGRTRAEVEPPAGKESLASPTSFDLSTRTRIRVGRQIVPRMQGAAGWRLSTTLDKKAPTMKPK